MILGVAYAAMGGLMVLASYTAVPEEGIFDLTLVSDGIASTQFQIVVSLAFLLPTIAVLGIAYVSYRQRRYVLDDTELITARKKLRSGGVGFSQTSDKQTVSYDDVDTVEFRQSFVQSLYGAGTVVVNPASNVDPLRMSYVQSVETFYSDLRSKIVESGAEDVDIPPRGTGDSPAGTQTDDPTSLSGERLATEMSSEYTMPAEIIRPQARSAAIYGAIYASIILGFFGTAFFMQVPLLLSFFLPALPWGTIFSLYLLCIPLFSGLYYYRMYNNAQYELYPDSVRRDVNGDVETAEFDDVDAVSVKELTGGGFQSGNHVATLLLRDANGNKLLSLKYVEDPRKVKERLDGLLENYSQA
jgi:hypothetical protein